MHLETTRNVANDDDDSRVHLLLRARTLAISRLLRHQIIAHPKSGRAVHNEIKGMSPDPLPVVILTEGEGLGTRLLLVFHRIETGHVWRKVRRVSSRPTGNGATIAG